MTDSWTLRLPYTTPPLSMNGRMHWATKARITREIHVEVAHRLRWNNVPKLQHCHVTLTYIPKSNRRRDADNLVATLKPCIDAIVASGRVPDDSPEYVTWEPPIIAPADPSDPRIELRIEARA